MAWDANSIYTDEKKKEQNRRRRYAFMTFGLCFIKMYLISCLQGGVTLFRDISDYDEFQLRMAFLFGYIITGNIVDNVGDPKNLAISL